MPELAVVDRPHGGKPNANSRQIPKDNKYVPAGLSGQIFCYINLTKVFREDS